MPRVLMTDRGAGFYNAGNGRITDEYKGALAEHGLEAFMGESAAVQPGKLSDCLLHETAVSWVRLQLVRTVPRKAWEENSKQYFQRLKRIASSINAGYNVSGLCSGFPGRVETLRAKQGGKLRK